MCVPSGVAEGAGGVPHGPGVSTHGSHVSASDNAAAAANGHTARPGSTGSHGVDVPVSEAGAGRVLALAERLVGLEHTCGVTGSHVTGYLKAAAKSMLTLLAPHEAALLHPQHAPHHAQHQHHHVQDQHRHVVKVYLELKEMVAAE